MSASTWTIQRTRTGDPSATTSRTLADWNITAAQLHLISRDLDTLNLVQTLPIDQADDFTNGDILRLYKEGTQVFMGRVVKPVRLGSAKSEQRATLVCGPWWYAQHAVATQDWRGGPSAALRAIPWLNLYVKFGATTPTIGSALTTLITQLQGKGAPITVGAIDVRGTPPPKLIENVSYSEAIFLALEECIDAVTWFDYSEASPAFHVRDPENLTPVTIAIGSDVPVGSPRVVDFNLARHDNDAVTFVEIILKEKADDAMIVQEDGEDVAVWRSDYTAYRYPAAATDPFGGHSVCIEKTDPMDDWNPLEFCQRAYEAYSAVLYQGDLTMKGDEINLNLRPGIRLNLTGAGAEAETMDALVQEVTHDLFAGTTNATFGPPPRLPITGFLQRQIALRRQRNATNDDKRDQESGYTATFDEEQNDEVGARLKVVLAVENRDGTYTAKLVQLPKSAAATNLP